jgi:Ricin-type beta-trefoil lectin domain
MDEPSAGVRRGLGRWIRGQGRAGFLRWAPLAAVAVLLASVALTPGASVGTAYADSALDTTGAWSGYVLHGGTYYSASADFTVPGGSCSGDPSESGRWTGFWVGLQGKGGIVQTGFTVNCNNGQAEYSGFHAAMTGVITHIAKPMQAGDQVYESVACLFFTCSQTVQDRTRNWTDTIQLPVVVGFSGSIAAIAGESSGGGVTTGPVPVTNALVNGRPIGQMNPEADQQNPANYGGTAGLDPTPLGPSGTSFGFYWNGSTGSGSASGDTDRTAPGQVTPGVPVTPARSEVTWQDNQTHLCLDSNYHDPKASNPQQGAVYTDHCNGGLWQKWAITYVGNGTVTLSDVQTGYCLDSNPDPASPSLGDVYTLPCNGGRWQEWYVGVHGPYDWFLRDAQTGDVLDSNYTNPAYPSDGAVYADRCNGGPYQEWTYPANGGFIPIPAVPAGTPPPCN